MQYRLRTLMIWLAIGPPLFAGAWMFFRWAGVYASAQLVVAIVVATIATWISFWPERRFYRELKLREPLSDCEFFRQFYADTDVPADLVRRLRPIYCKLFYIDPAKVRPLDRPPLLDDLDTSDLVHEIEAEFGLAIPHEHSEPLDGSFDSIVRYLAQRHAKEGHVGHVPLAS